MENLKRKIEQKREELDELVLELCAKAKLNEYHPNFHIKEKCEKAASWVLLANGKLFYTITSLGH